MSEYTAIYLIDGLLVRHDLEGVADWETAAAAARSEPYTLVAILEQPLPNGGGSVKG